MKKCLTILLAAAMVLSMAACGSSGGNAAASTASAETASAATEAATEAEAEAKAGGKEEAKAGDAADTKEETAAEQAGGSGEPVLWDSGEDLKINYDEDASVLYDANGVKFFARRMNYSSGELSFFTGVRNGTDEVIRSKGVWITNEENHAGGSKSDPKKDGSGAFRMAAAEEWNCLLGDTEDCKIGTFQLEIMNETELMDTVRFDIYSSETTPYKNIVTGAESVIGFVPMAEGEKSGSSGSEASNAGEQSGQADAGKKDELGDYQLMCATNYTETSQFGQALTAYFDQIKEVTEGHVEINTYFGGSLFGRDEIEDGLIQGMIDIGTVYTVPNLNQYWLSNVVGLPFQGFGDAVKATRLLWDLYDTVPEVAAEWNSDLKMVQLFAVTPATLEGTIPMNQMSSGSVINIINAESGFSEQIFHMLGIGPRGVCFSKEAWEKLPEEYREKIESIGRDPSTELAAAAYADMKKAGEEYGYTPEADLLAHWESYSDDYAAQWAAKAAEKTSVDGEALLAKAKELIAGY